MVLKTLVRHFFSRFFDKDSISPNAEAHANVVQIIAMLAIPGAFLSISTLADFPSLTSDLTRLWMRAGDRYTFVCYAMAVMGFVMTFKWDSLFPDRRDYLILTPLPISLRDFFTAKVISLLGFLCMFAVAINVVSCVFIPYSYGVRNNSFGPVLPGLLAHATATLSASIFTALFFGALQGVLINLMSPAAFRRLSTWFQLVAMTALVTLLLITTGISGNLRLLVEGNVRVLDYIPVFWFLGIYEVLNPEGTLIPAAPLWAARAVEATLVVGLIFIVTYLISYRRYSKKILEGIESNVFADPWRQRAAAWLLNHTLLRNPARRASYYFMGRIFGRSSKHRLFIAMYGGVGLAMTITSLFVLRHDVGYVISVSQTGLLEAPLVLSFFAVSALRAVFNMPHELNANWIFQITSGTQAAEYMTATRQWVLMRGVLPVYVAIAPLEFLFFTPGEALFHMAFGLGVSILLAEIFFYNFNKVPFTCAYFPAKSHLAFLAAAYLYGFTIYTFTMTGLQRWTGQSPVRALAFFTLVVGVPIMTSFHRRSPANGALRIIYEDHGEPLVQQLNLLESVAREHRRD